MSEGQTYRNESGDHRYFTSIPNLLLDHRKVTPDAFRLYAHYKRRAGDSGECFESNENVAQETGLSAATVKRARALLNELGLITVEDRSERRLPALVTMRDIWPANTAAYDPARRTNMAQDEPSENPMAQAEPSHGSEGAMNMAQPEPIRKTPLKKNQEEKPSTKKRARPRSLLDDPAVIAGFKAKHPSINVERELQKFDNHDPNRRRPLSDYVAGFENWCLNAEDFSNGRTTSTRSTSGRAQPTGGNEFTLGSRVRPAP